MPHSIHQQVIFELEGIKGTINGLISDIESGYLEEEEEGLWDNRIHSIIHDLTDIIGRNKNDQKGDNIVC